MSVIAVPEKQSRLFGPVAAVSALGLVAVVVFDATHGLAGLLVAGFFGLCLTIGAALLCAINVVTGARWWQSLAHVPGRLSRVLPVPAAALAIALVFGVTRVYPWAAAAGAAAGGHAVHGKEAWLNVPFFLLRAAVILGLWMWLVRRLSALIEAAHKDPSGPEAQRVVKAAIVFILVFGVTISVGSWDWMMSLEPAWFSTMFGVYGFAGAFAGGIALVTVVTLVTVPEVTEKQRHDLGKLLFAFSFFWGYIWFCQFMLIWYADLPEETTYFISRMTGGWMAAFLANGALNFAVPFLVLLSQPAKKSPRVLMAAAVVVLVGRWFDTWLMVAPATGGAVAVAVAGGAGAALVLAGMGLALKRQRDAG